MAQTLRYADELLAGFPDNTSQLVTPVNLRDSVVSNLIGRCYIATATPVTLALTLDVPLLVNPLLQSVAVVPGAWRVDANFLFTPDYAAVLPTTIIPPGYQKLVSVLCTMNFDKAGQQGSLYDLQFVDAGVPIGVPFVMEIAGTGEQSVSVVVDRLFNVSASHQLGIQVTATNSGTDLFMNSLEMRVQDSMVSTEPVAP